MNQLFAFYVAQEYGLADLNSEVAPGWTGRDAIDRCIKEEDGHERLLSALVNAADDLDVPSIPYLQLHDIVPGLFARALYEGLDLQLFLTALESGALAAADINPDLFNALTEQDGIKWYNAALEHECAEASAFACV